MLISSADARIERRREVDLDTTSIRSTWMRPRRAAPDRGSARRYCRPSATSRPASERWAISAVVVDLPLVPVIATNGASGARAPRSRQNNSMSPMISIPGRVRELHGPMRRRMGQRHAGRENEHAEAAPVGGGEIDERDARGGGALARRRVVVPGGDLGAAGDERARGRQPGAAEAEHATLRPCKPRPAIIVTSASASTGRSSRARRR